MYAYAYSRWGLKAPAYSTLPVQAMARIAVSEEADSIRDEQDVGLDPQETNSPEQTNEDAGEEYQDETGSSASSPEVVSRDKHRKYIATLQEIQDAFDGINTLRYSQPTHLAGTWL